MNEPPCGRNIKRAIHEAHVIAIESKQRIEFEFNGHNISVDWLKSEPENYLAAKKVMGLPEIDIPFHPQTAKDALARWDDGKTVFTIEMGGIGPGYEQAIQCLVFEIIRGNLDTKLPPESDKTALKSFWDTFGDADIHRVNDQYGYSGAQVGAAKQIAYRALRDGWEKMLESAPDDRKIQVSKHFPGMKEATT